MRRLPVYLLLDTSGSMRNEPIAAVNRGVQALTTLLMRNPTALETVYLSVITFDDHAKQVVPLTEILSFRCPTLTVQAGLTSLGAGLKLVAERIEREVVTGSAQAKGDWKPLVFLMTDGEPTDDWQAGIEAFRKVRTGMVVACAAGQDCDTYVLKKITENVIEMDKVDGPTLERFFQWVSASVDTASRKVEKGGGGAGGLDEMPALPDGLKKARELRRGGGGDDPYTPFKGINAIRAANKDRYGNPDGAEYDLAKDGAFKGLRIAVLHLYTGEGFDFRLPAAALAEKGFSIERWQEWPPAAGELARALESACQLWVISNNARRLGADHLAVIRTFFESGRGVYIWGDNWPFYADANQVAGALFKGRLGGFTTGDKVVHIKNAGDRSGMVPTHLITTGLENLYEGITISTVKENPLLQPVVYGSSGKVVVSAYDRDGKRALIDGGFTRLFFKWDTAGTGRYVKNAAAWLVNYERFGRSLLRK
jgi:uncharacterized protein YegL